jgi:hypothetical protein
LNRRLDPHGRAIIALLIVALVAVLAILLLIVWMVRDEDPAIRAVAILQAGLAAIAGTSAIVGAGVRTLTRHRRRTDRRP